MKFCFFFNLSSLLLAYSFRHFFVSGSVHQCNLWLILHPKTLIVNPAFFSRWWLVVNQNKRGNPCKSFDFVMLSAAKHLCGLEYADWQDSAIFYGLETLRPNKSGLRVTPIKVIGASAKSLSKKQKKRNFLH